MYPGDVYYGRGQEILDQRETIILHLGHAAKDALRQPELFKPGELNCLLNQDVMVEVGLTTYNPHF